MRFEAETFVLFGKKYGNFRTQNQTSFFIGKQTIQFHSKLNLFSLSGHNLES